MFRQIIVLLFLLSSVYLVIAVDLEDIEYLRISNNQFDGKPVNYHNISPERGSSKQPKYGTEEITNQIGKPLIQFIPTRSPTTAAPWNTFRKHTNNSSGGRQLLDTTRGPWLTSKPDVVQRQKKKYDLIGSTHIPQMKSIIEKQLTTPSSFAATTTDVTTSYVTPLPPVNTCRWMTMNDFQDVSFETGEIIIRDEIDQPCYILTLMAFVKWNDTAYFPLKNYKSHPRAYKFGLDEPSLDAPEERLVLNCSMPESLGKMSRSTNISLVPVRKKGTPSKSFKEEITISVECGYLIFKIRGDNSRLSLESISFYQDADAIANSSSTSRKTASTSWSSPLPRIKSPSMEQEHLVFTSEGFHESPLLSMPLISRYTCQNRIVLTGNNSIQLVLDKFELQRLTHQPPVVRQQQDSVQNLTNVSVNHNSSNKTSSVAQTNSWSSRSRRDTTILFKSPLIAVTRCPNPSSPTSPLRFMMDPVALKGDTVANGGTAEASKSSADRVEIPVFFSDHSMLKNILILGLVGQIVKYHLMGSWY